MYPKTFLEVVKNHPGYLEGPPTSGLYNVPTPMVTRVSALESPDVGGPSRYPQRIT